MVAKQQAWQAKGLGPMDSFGDIRFGFFLGAPEGSTRPPEPSVPEQLASQVPRAPRRKTTGSGVLTAADAQRFPEPAISDLTH